MRRFKIPSILLVAILGMLGAAPTGDAQATSVTIASDESLGARVEALEKTLAEMRSEISRLHRIIESHSAESPAREECRGNGEPAPPAASFPPTAQGPAAAAASSAAEDPAPLQYTLLQDLSIFGFFSARYEKEFSVPRREDGRVVETDSPGEFSFPFFHLMARSELADKYAVFININGDGGDTLDLRNFWGEYSPTAAFNIRIGKTYRRFDLYNEILDSVPTYIGVEPPEGLDSDHLLVSRTANVMVHGKTDLLSGDLAYSLTIDDGEGNRLGDSYPLGLDLNYLIPSGAILVGASAYDSIGRTGPGVGVGDGPPNGGVLPWMASDRFKIFGGYFESNLGRLTLQGAYWKASHDARRDPLGIIEVIENTELNDNQLARFLLDVNSPAEVANIRIRADYDVRTWYFRAGYSIDTRVGEWVPYFIWDWYSNPETIAEKKYGGDNEAGRADDGQFHKPTIGFIYRPIPKVAIKLDGSSHRFKMAGRDVSFPEIRFDFSFIFGH